MNGADQLLLPAVVTDGAPRSLDAARQRGIGNGAPVPDPLDQFVLADDAATVLDEVEE
jgi:hypothetical protein